MEPPHEALHNGSSNGPMEDDVEAGTMVEEYIQLIKAALERVEPGYYRLATTYEPSGIIRERAFCYELYHQIRSSMRP